MTVEEMHKECAVKLHQYVTRCLTNDVDEVDDVVQDVFYLAYRNRKKLEEHENPIGWIFNTAKNLIKRIQYGKKTVQLEWDIPFIPEDNLWEVMPIGLPEVDKSIIIYHVQYRYNLEETAEQVGLTYEACKSRMRRLKQRLYTDFVGTQQNGGGVS